jgi:hypothetical protein
MGNGKLRGVADPHTFRPKQDIDIEHSCPPRLTAPNTPEMGFNLKQAGEQGWRIEIARHDDGCVGISTPRCTDWCRLDRRRLRKNIDIVHFQRSDRLCNHFCRFANDGMRLVRPEAKEIGIRQARYPLPTVRRAVVCGHGRNPCSHGVPLPDQDRKWRPSRPSRSRPIRSPHRPTHW